MNNNKMDLYMAKKEKFYTTKQTHTCDMCIFVGISKYMSNMCFMDCCVFKRTNANLSSALALCWKHVSKTGAHK